MASAAFYFSSSQQLNSILVEMIGLWKESTCSSKQTAERRRCQKPNIMDEFWKQLNHLISKTVVNWWLVKSDQRDRSSFISAVSAHRCSYLRPCLHCMFMKKQRMTDSNNKEAQASELGCSAAATPQPLQHSCCSVAVAAHLPLPPPPYWPHVVLSLRQQPNYMRFIELHSIFILILLNGTVNKWFTLMQRGRNWWEMQMTKELGVSATSSDVTALEWVLYWLWNGQLFNFSACYYCIKMRLCSISAN